MDLLTSSCLPIIKWPGGKQKLAATISAMLPEGRFIEPFAGGAAVFFHRLPKRAWLNDINPELATLYRAVRDSSETVIDLLRQWDVSEETFARIRAWDRDPSYLQRSDAERAARLIYLTRTCFNGVYRLNRAGHFNTSYGRMPDTRELAVQRIRAASAAMCSIDLTVTSGSYRDVLASAVAGDSVYIDPPYIPASKTANFMRYAATGFGMADHERLADDVRGLSGRGVAVVVSNSDTPLTRNLYAGFTMVGADVMRHAGAASRTRIAASELLITNIG